jgi:hypothetical protein
MIMDFFVILNNENSILQIFNRLRAAVQKVTASAKSEKIFLKNVQVLRISVKVERFI